MKLFKHKTVQHPATWLSGAAIALSLVSLGNMNRWSIWFDESFGAYLLRFGYGGIAKYTAVDVHPPLYYWVLKFWTDLFGQTEVAFRSLSLIFALVTLFGVFVLIRKLFDTRLALVASWAIALSPMLIRYSDEARMYTMVTAIGIWATYVLVRLMEKPTTKKWVLYGVLVAAGMWTHYFSALIWLAHWAWRALLIRDKHRKGKRLAAFFTKQWIWTHVLAVGLFAAWVPFLFKQFATVQEGFWIPQITPSTPLDYVSNSFMYLTHGWIGGWVTLLLFALIGLAVWAVLRAAPTLMKKSKDGYRLLLSLVVIPPILLVIVSMPPLKSSFVDRYILLSMLLLVVLVAMSCAVLIEKKLRGGKLTVVVIAASLIFGIYNVYHFGNYNFVSRTSIRTAEVVRGAAEASKDGVPIIADSPWVYYEAAFYDSKQHPVYFLANSTNYQWGSLAMLRDSSMGKIEDLDAFTRDHRYVWYMGNVGSNEITPPNEDWEMVKKLSVYDDINDGYPYKAVLYDTAPNAE